MSDVGVGDAEIPYLVVTPADGTTVVTLTVTAPDGTADDVPMTPGPLQPASGIQTQKWTAGTAVVYDRAGRWLLHWQVTGTGQGAEDVEVYVVASPVAGGPTWLPGRSRVAAYVPHRTLARSVESGLESDDRYAMTFDSTTVPDGVSVSRLIADGAAVVLGRVGTLAPSLYEMASVAVTLYAASWVERSWPDGDQSQPRADAMDKRLDGMLADLVEANEVATGGGGIDIVYPVFSFPPADPRWDCNRYW